MRFHKLEWSNPCWFIATRDLLWEVIEKSKQNQQKHKRKLGKSDPLSGVFFRNSDFL